VLSPFIKDANSRRISGRCPKKTAVEDVDENRQLMMSRKTIVVDVAKIEDIDESVKDVNNVKDVRGIEEDEKM